MTTGAAESPALSAEAPPALPAEELERALPCPLCDYDLRGLPAGRCPECGHAFDPTALRLEARTRPERFFEHHKRQPIRSFLRTLVAGWRPKRFWAAMTPSAPIVPRRLAAYALLVLLLGIAGSMAGFVGDVATRTNQSLEWIRESEADYASATPVQKREMDRWGGSSFQKYLRTVYPLPTQALFWQRYNWRHFLQQGPPLALLVLAWPALTMATLLIFRRSLRQAKIRFGHVARVMVYSADVLAFTLPVLLLMAGLRSAGALPIEDVLRKAPFPLDHIFYILPGVDGVLLMTAVLLLLLAGWRLARAYQLYLRFPHAIATVLASQIIVWLALVTFGAPVLEWVEDLLYY